MQKTVWTVKRCILGGILSPVLVVVGCSGMYLAVLGCTGLYRAVLGCTGLYWAVLYCTGRRCQQEFSIPGILGESQLHFFSLDHEKLFSIVSISSRNMRVTISNLVLVSKCENDHLIVSISSRQVRARKIILNLVWKNCTFSRE